MILYNRRYIRLNMENEKSPLEFDKNETLAYIEKQKTYLAMDIPEDEKEWLRNVITFWEKKLDEK